MLLVWGCGEWGAFYKCYKSAQITGSAIIICIIFVAIARMLMVLCVISRLLFNICSASTLSHNTSCSCLIFHKQMRLIHSILLSDLRYQCPTYTIRERDKMQQISSKTLLQLFLFQCANLQCMMNENVHNEYPSFHNYNLLSTANIENQN